MRRLLAVALATFALTTGCSPEPGTPTPEKTTPEGAGVDTTPSSQPPSSSPRPRELKLDDTAPCGLLTAEQLPSLKIDRAGRTVEVDAYQATGCSWTVTGASSRLVPVTKEGIEVWTDGKRTGQASRIEPIMGFPAITVILPGQEASCDAMVDTANGQYLLATATVNPNFEDRFPKPCDGARKLAEAAIQNLLK
jgi:hypothetical protein